MIMHPSLIFPWEGKALYFFLKLGSLIMQNASYCIIGEPKFVILHPRNAELSLLWEKWGWDVCVYIWYSFQVLICIVPPHVVLHKMTPCFCLGFLPVLLEISRLLNTGLDMESLSICVRLCEQGINPEALSLVIKELRKASDSLKVCKYILGNWKELGST